jgi:hypothetical protein
MGKQPTKIKTMKCPCKIKKHCRCNKKSIAELEDEKRQCGPERRKEIQEELDFIYYGIKL